MKKFLIVAAFSILALSTYAQKGNDYIGLAADFGFGTGDLSDGAGIGLGGSARLLLGVGAAGQMTFTTGINAFTAKARVSDPDFGDLNVKSTISIIPFLIGYRHNIKGFYFEPRAGVGIYGAKVKGTVLGEEQSESDSQSAFTWAVGSGYVSPKGLEIGIRFQSGQVDDSNISLFGVHIGYNFNLHGKK